MTTATLETTNAETRIAQLNEEITSYQAGIRAAQADIFKLTPQFTEEQKATIKATVRKLREAKYQTTHGLTIYSLRQAGNIVRVTHIRYTTLSTKYGNPLVVPVPSYLRGNFDFNARGGATHITITNEATGDSFSVSSICDATDSFDYKMGVKLALDQLTTDDIKALTA